MSYLYEIVTTIKQCSDKLKYNNNNTVSYWLMLTEGVQFDDEG